MGVFRHLPSEIGWFAKVNSRMVMAKSSRLLRNWQNALNCSNEIPRVSGMRSWRRSKTASYPVESKYVYLKRLQPNFFDGLQTNVVCEIWCQMPHFNYNHTNTKICWNAYYSSIFSLFHWQTLIYFYLDGLIKFIYTLEIPFLAILGYLFQSNKCGIYIYIYKRHLCRLNMRRDGTWIKHITILSCLKRHP